MIEPRRRPVTAIGWISVAAAVLLWAAAFTADGLIHSRYTNIPGFIGTTILLGGLHWDRRVEKRRAAAQRSGRGPV